MIIGVPRERKTLEKRIAITPDGAQALIKRGHTVLIEQDAGLGSHFTNEQYRAVGCTLVPTLKDVWTKAELVVKVKEPHPEEYQHFRDGLTLFDYLHLASMPDVTEALLRGKMTSIGYELVQTQDNRLPLLEPMSEVAGKLSVLNGGYFLLSQNGGRGMLLGGTVGVEPANVVIIGAGISGRKACEMAVGSGAQVTILDISYKKLDAIVTEFGSRVRALYSTPASLAREIATADLLIGAVLVPGAAAPKIVTREMVKAMKPGSVFVDISIDQGGCGETMKPTLLDKPTFIEENVIHYGVCNMPAQTPRTSTMALTSATLPYIMELANKGIRAALDSSRELRNALNTHKGKLTNKAVSDAVGISYTPIEDALRS